MKKIRLALLLALVLTAMAACGQEEEDMTDPTDAGTDSVVHTTITPNDTSDSSQDESPEQDDAQPPREGMARSLLTNEWVDGDVAAARPIAVVIPNDINAVPHYSLSQASVIYEANVEGRMTRMMALYEDWEGLEKIGNVRSTRTYYMYWAFEWDAFIVHFGGPFFINDLVAEESTQHVDGNLNLDSAAFFRDTTRATVYNNAYATGSGLADIISRKGYPLEYRGLTDDSHFRFADEEEPNSLDQYNEEAKSATYIDMSGCYPLTRCYFEYNEEDGLYYRSQHLSGGTDGPHLDEVNGEQLTFKNILVQYIKYEELGNGYMAFQCHDTTMDGWFFTNGKGIHVNWAKTSDYGATRYYDDYGNEVALNTGKTMICIVRDGENFNFR